MNGWNTFHVTAVVRVSCGLSLNLDRTHSGNPPRHAEVQREMTLPKRPYPPNPRRKAHPHGCPTEQRATDPLLKGPPQGKGPGATPAQRNANENSTHTHSALP